MTSEQRIAEVYAAAFVSDGARITGLHNRPFIAEAHANALKAVIASVRAEAIEEIERMCESMKVKNMFRTNRLPAEESGFNEALYQVQRRARALVKERKGDE